MVYLYARVLCLDPSSIYFRVCARVFFFCMHTYICRWLAGWLAACFRSLRPWRILILICIHNTLLPRIIQFARFFLVYFHRCIAWLFIAIKLNSQCLHCGRMRSLKFHIHLVFPLSFVRQQFCFSLVCAAIDSFIFFFFVRC